MLNIHATRRRPGHWLAMALAVIALPLLAACAGAAESDSESTGSMTQGDSGAGNAAAPADAVVINLPIVGRETVLTRDDLRLSQGDAVRLNHYRRRERRGASARLRLVGAGFARPTRRTGLYRRHCRGLCPQLPRIRGGRHGWQHGRRTPRDGRAGDSSPGIPGQHVAIAATATADGGVNVSIDAEGFQFTPESVDQAHTPGAGHAHIYVDGEKLGRVFESDYSIESLPPGEHEIRVSLNANDHRDLTYEGRKLEATTTVSVPDVGQGQSRKRRTGTALAADTIAAAGMDGRWRRTPRRPARMGDGEGLRR